MRTLIVVLQVLGILAMLPAFVGILIVWYLPVYSVKYVIDTVAMALDAGKAMRATVATETYSVCCDEPMCSESHCAACGEPCAIREVRFFAHIRRRGHAQCELWQCLHANTGVSCGEYLDAMVDADEHGFGFYAPMAMSADGLPIG